jgi:serine/threonine protein kinase
MDPSLPQVFGRYLLVQRLSRGGMGEIFLAKHGLAGFEKLCVIKKVLSNLAEDTSFISRFIDEAQVAIKLQHVNIAQVFEVGRVGDEYFLALEHVEGRDLRRTLTTLAQRGASFPVDLALFVTREVANGLAYAHRRLGLDGGSLNLVHCDISPPNVLVSFEGETKVIDFGIAKSALRATATDPKMGFGKFGYMAPEQLIRGGIVDHRTDIYATGCVLYELLTGQRLYEVSENPDYRALARMVARGEHRLPSDHDPLLAPYDELVVKALRPKAEDRYQTAAELRDALQGALVTVNPTISTDALGAFMRDVFADEMSALKENHDRLARLHLADFRNELTTASIATVSFALANLPLYAPPTTPVERVSELAAGSLQGAQVPGLAASRPRSKWIAPAAIGAVAAIGAIAFAMRGPAPVTPVAEGPAIVAPPPGPAVAVVAPDAAAPIALVAPIDAAMDEVEMPPSVVDPPRPPTGAGSGGGPRHPPREHPAVGAGSAGSGSGSAAEPGAVSAAAVQAKFREVLREYRAFKQSYGSVLEGEWTEIATAAQYAKAPEKLAALDKKLDRFRAQMKAQR